MATIPLTFEQMRQNYPQQLQELSMQVQNSKGQDRNMAPEDMNWSIDYCTIIQPLNLFDLMQGRGRDQAAPRNEFSLQVKAGRITKSVRINFTPVEFTRQQQNQEEQKARTEELLATSLTRANNDPNGMWLRLSAVDDNGRPTIHAFPILAGFWTSRDKAMIITDSYEQLHGSYFLEDGTRAVILNKNGTDRLITSFQNSADGAEVRVQNRTLTKMSQEEIKAITDFSVYREDFSKALPGLVGIEVPMALPPRPRRR